MVDFFNRFYLVACGQSRILAKLRFYSALRWIVRFLANSILPFYFRATKRGKRGVMPLPGAAGERAVVVSMTSFPARIEKTWLVVESLLRQSRQADLIVLWLSKEQFPTLNSVPASLLRLQSEGLRIEIRDGDLRSHKKYFYSLKDFSDSILILTDDDIYYPSSMIETLLNANRETPNRVICRFTKRITWGHEGGLSRYLDWGKVNDGKLGRDYFFGSGGGVLIPPGAISYDALNEAAFTSICPYADDVWLNAMCRLVSNEMFSLKQPFVLLPVVNEDPQDLSSINNGRSLNDLQITSVREYCLSVHRLDPFCTI